MIQFRKATLDDLDLLVDLRIHDLKRYSQQTISDMTIQNIRLFYQEKLEKDECMTLLGYDQEYLIATSSLYQYRVMPSNENPAGKVGQITNVWVHENYRQQGLATKMIKCLIDENNQQVGMICLNSSSAGMSLYQKCGFIQKENYFVMYTE